MFELKFIFFVVFLPLVVVLLFSVAWRSFVQFCGYSLNDFIWQGDHDEHSKQEINPATGLPMIGGGYGLDAAGNAYGCNFNNNINSNNSWNS
jgi:hypothetical protein